jgi:ATP-dependent DNA helicase RecQ
MLAGEVAKAALLTANLAPLRKAYPRALGQARQVARFLCGISSPALSTAKLTRHPLFGSATHMPFGKVIAAVEGSATT